MVWGILNFEYIKTWVLNKNYFHLYGVEYLTLSTLKLEY